MVTERDNSRESSANEAPLASQMETMLNSLDAALAEMTAAVAGLKGLLGDVSSHEGIVAEMEAILSRARGGTVATGGTPTPQMPANVHPLRTVEPAAAEPESAPAPEAEATPEPEAYMETPAASAPEPITAEEGNSFRLQVEAKHGSLDLRKVDQALTDDRGVTDVALLDYDGHKAVLKVWLDPAIDAEDTKTSIRDSIMNGMSGEAKISFDDES